MKDKIIEALARLDTANDEHWTTEGLPRLDVMKEIVGGSVSRSDVTEAVKGFTRNNPESLNPVEEVQPPVEAPEADDLDLPSEVEASEVDAANEDLLTGEVEVSEVDAIEAELVAARVALVEAQTRVNIALKVKDALIVAAEKVDNRRNYSLDVKEYQRSQQAQREQQSVLRGNAVKAIVAAKDRY